MEFRLGYDPDECKGGGKLKRLVLGGDVAIFHLPNYCGHLFI